MLDPARRPISVNRLEPVEFLHGFEFFLNVTLISDKAAVHIRRAVHVHSGFPVVQHRVLPQVPFDENSRTHREIKNGIRNERDAVYLSNPRRLNAADDRSCHQRVDITICQDDEAGAQRRNDSVFELVGEIGRVEQAECSRAQNVSLHRPLELAADEHRPLQSDIHRWITEALEPIAQ